MTTSEGDGAARRSASAGAPPPSARVSLAVAILAGEAAGASGAERPVGPGDRCILVVSFNADLRRYLRECLRDRADTAVLEAPTGADALVTLRSGAVHLVIADEAEAGALLAVPIPIPTIIVATGGAGQPAPTSGAAAFITLPFSATTILAAIDRVL